MSEARRLFRIAWEERRSARFTIHRSGVAPSDVDDVLQTTMLDAWRLLAWGVYEPPEGVDERIAVRAWLRGVARIAARQHRAKRRPTTPLPDDIERHPLVAQLEAREEIRVAFYRLNRVEKSLVAGYAQGETLREVGARMRMPWPTAWTKLRAVRRVLRKRLDREK